MRYLGYLIALLIGCAPDAQLRDTSQLSDTEDLQGPYMVTTVTTAGTWDAITLVYRVASRDGSESDPVRVSMTEVQQDVFQGGILGQRPGSLVRYHVELEGGSGVLTDPPSAAASDGGYYAFWVLEQACRSAAECDPEERCDASGVCRPRTPGCTSDTECGRAFRCFEGSCRLAARTCISDDGCFLGEVCDRLLGECVARPQCDGGTTCPVAYDCIAELQVCSLRCAGDSECWSGALCLSGQCAAPQPCNDGSSCPSGTLCDGVTGRCRGRGADLCAACVEDADCGGAFDHCVPSGVGFRCGRDCSLVECPAGFQCDVDRQLPQCVPIDRCD